MVIDRKQKLGETLVRVINKIVENQKKPRRYGLEELLYPSEIHTIMLIGKNRGSGVTDLAARAGITKGAISQMVNKLETKGLIKKYANPDNNAKVVLELTNKGKVAFYSHERLHEAMDQELYSFLDSLSKERMTILEDFFELLERGTDKRSET